MKFSIIIPAHNEASHIGLCLNAIAQTATPYPNDVEIIVVLNRCTDETAHICRDMGVRTVICDEKNLSKIRNAGVAVAAGDIMITVDADSRMSPNMLSEIERALQSGHYIGGGVPIKPERMSLGIFLTGLLIASVIMPLGLSGGLFWCYRNDFNAIGGFNEDMVIAEDIDFAKRLKKYGQTKGKRFGTLWKAHILTSCRKFDTFGDWFVIKRPWVFFEALRGKSQKFGNRFYYDYKKNVSSTDYTD